MANTTPTGRAGGHRRPLSPAEQKFRADVIDTIRSVIFAPANAGKLAVIKRWQTETIFTTPGLDSIFPPDAASECEHFHTGNKIVYDVKIVIKDRMPSKIVFIAMFTDLSLEPHNIDIRNNILDIYGKKTSPDKNVSINLMDNLPVNDSSTFLDTLKRRVEYFIKFAIPLFESEVSSHAATSRGMAGVDGNGKPTGRVSSKMQRTATYDSNPQLVLTVKADFMANSEHDLYLRYISYGNYNGDDWLKGPVYKGSAPYNAYFLTRDAMKAKGHSSHNIEVKLEPSVVEFSYPCFAYSNADVVNDVKIPGDIGPEHTYSLDVIPYENPRGYSATNVAEEQKYRKFVHKHYLDVPESTLKTIKDILSRLDWNHRMDFWELICMVCGYFRNGFVYSYNFDYSADKDVVDAFLNSGKKYDDGFGRGICDHFSSAVTLIFRALGLPARKTSGYVCHHNGSNTIPVTTNNCHGWVEVYKDGLGWVIVDPTASVKQDHVP